MLKRFFTILFLVLSIFSQSKWDKYTLINFDSLLIKHNYMIVNNGDFIYSQKLFPYSSILNYGDSIRTATKQTSYFFKNWAFTMQRPQIDSLFTHEILFYFNNKKYWIPTQFVLVNHFKSELIENDKVKIFLAVFGGVKEQLYFGINEFEKL